MRGENTMIPGKELNLAGKSDMAPPDKRNCMLEEQNFPEGTQVCAHRVCMECDGGEWRELSEAWPRGEWDH